MVVKSLKRKSITSSGAWEVEDTAPAKPKKEGNKQLKVDTSSLKSESQIELISDGPSKSEEKEIAKKETKKKFKVDTSPLKSQSQIKLISVSPSKSEEKEIAKKETNKKFKVDTSLKSVSQVELISVCPSKSEEKEIAKKETNKSLEVDTSLKSESQIELISVCPSKSEEKEIAKKETNKQLKVDTSLKSESRIELISDSPSKSEEKEIANKSLTTTPKSSLPGTILKNNEEQENQPKPQRQEGQQQEPNEDIDLVKRKNKIPSWRAGDLLRLVVNLEEICSNLLLENYSEAIEKVDWSKISFGEHSAEECKDTWLALFQEARSTRQQVEEVREMLLHKKTVQIEQGQSQHGESSLNSSQEFQSANTKLTFDSDSEAEENGGEESTEEVDVESESEEDEDD